MNWLNLRTSTFRAPEYIGAEPVIRATWMNVLAFCCEQENCGRIVGAQGWKDRQWQQTCGVTKDEVDGSAPLLFWEGDDLVVWQYPKEKETEVQGKRDAGARGGLSKAKRAREAHPEENPSSASSSATSSASSSANGSASTEGERKENRKEGEGNGTSTLPPSSTAGGVSEGANSKRTPTTEQSKRVARIFHRRQKTNWTEDEYRAYRKIGTVPEEDLAALEKYYADNWPPDRDSNILRHDLQTFLNNFSGEVDRAKMHAIEKGPKEEVWKADWKPWLDSQDITDPKFQDYQFAPDFLKSRFHNDRKATAQ